MIENLHTPNSIRTNSGLYFDLKLMIPETIVIEDIAHALAKEQRFGNHLNAYSSVAQHSVMASRLVPDEYKFAALMHDASEAYLGDMPKPFKELMPDYLALEHRLMLVLARKFGFLYPLHPEVKNVDVLLLSQEWDANVCGEDNGWESWPFEYAKAAFLEAFHNLKPIV